MLDFSFFQSSYGVIFDVMDKKKTFNQTIKTELNEIESLIRLFYSYCICKISFVANVSTVVQCITKIIFGIFLLQNILLSIYVNQQKNMAHADTLFDRHR